MSTNEGSAQIVALGLLAILLFSAGCTVEKPGDIVTCSDYEVVIDEWSTPSGHFIKFSSGATYSTGQLEPVYPRLPHIGESAYCQWNQCRVLKLTPLTEQESGMRGACRVDLVVV